jgi:hypothetical protein
VYLIIWYINIPLHVSVPTSHHLADSHYTIYKTCYEMNTRKVIFQAGKQFDSCKLCSVLLKGIPSSVCKTSQVTALRLFEVLKTEDQRRLDNSRH